MNNILNNKRKNIIAICFTAFYLIMLLLDSHIDFDYFINVRFVINSILIGEILPLITPVFVLIFLFSANKEYKCKKWLLPIAFLVTLISQFFALYPVIYNFDLIVSAPQYAIGVLCSCIMFIAKIFTFIGTLFNFKYLKFLKYGALGCALITFVSIIIEVINNIENYIFLQLLNNSYGIDSVLFDYFNLTLFIKMISCILFYIGIFILTNTKKEDIDKNC